VPGDITINQSTISSNIATYSTSTGGGFYAEYTNITRELEITNSTFSYNEANQQGGGFYIINSGDTKLTVGNTLFTENSSSGSDLWSQAELQSAGYNLVDARVDVRGAFDGVGDMLATSQNPIEVNLGALQDNGGPTLTHALLSGSAAIDAGNPNNLEADQRGAEVFGDTRDIGAFEVNPEFLAPIIMDLDGQGVDIATFAPEELGFDANQNGITDSMLSWAGVGSGFLVYDYTGTGLVTHADQLAFVNYAEGAQTDLEGLRMAFDSNNDSIFNAEDELFSKFGIWEDKNQNAITDAGEFASLTEVGIEAISLVSDGQSAVYDSHIVFGYGDYLLSDGTIRNFADTALGYLEGQEDKPKVEASEALIVNNEYSLNDDAELIETADVITQEDDNLLLMAEEEPTLITDNEEQEYSANEEIYLTDNQLENDLLLSTSNEMEML
jgi:hypothetical protein